MPAADRLSLEQLYAQHARLVWRSLRRLGVRESDVADQMQEVFLVAFRKLDEFEGRAKPSTWLYAICTRVASDYRRSARVRREVVGEPPLPAVDRHDTFALVERNQARERLYALLERMPFEQRAVFCAFELEGMSGQEIADSLGVPLGTVKSRLRLAREAFREGLTQTPALRPLAFPPALEEKA